MSIKTTWNTGLIKFDRKTACVFVQDPSEMLVPGATCFPLPEYRAWLVFAEPAVESNAPLTPPADTSINIPASQLNPAEVSEQEAWQQVHELRERVAGQKTELDRLHQKTKAQVDLIADYVLVIRDQKEVIAAQRREISLLQIAIDNAKKALN